jgi:transcriptional regulator with XRE-family HTH domain
MGASEITANSWRDAEYGRTRPIAAPLEECARLLRIPVDQLTPAAAKVEPYPHADGSLCWSLFQLERELWPERFRHGAGKTRRKRKQESDEIPDVIRRPLSGRDLEVVEAGDAL